MSGMRVLAAMSGGVDSAVAAALLHEQGHAVTGVTLRLACYGKTPMSPKACCTLDAIDDARRVAMALDFPYHIIDAEDVFKHRVMMPFVDDYANGRTPYPCALCNQHLKFGDLVTRMELVGADRLATGHYAQVRPEADGSFGMYRAVDRDKDQTYALALIPYAVLSRVLFPLGELNKRDVRAHGQRMGLTCWDKAESQDLCFVPDGDYAGYITGTLGDLRGSAPGAFVDAAGRRLGTHRGLIHYTVGQRKGLGIAASEPLYVLAIDPTVNAVTLGPRSALESPGLVTAPFNWLAAAPPADGTPAWVRIRYNHAGAECTVHPCADGSVEVRFRSPQSAVTPGQLAVLYQGDRCLGGASIAHALAAPRPAMTTGALA
ncbi:MAG: tRNA 2-thiouridine(34) synthase MnmA [Candidatus Eisenbacteria bacterium]